LDNVENSGGNPNAATPPQMVAPQPQPPAPQPPQQQPAPQQAVVQPKAAPPEPVKRTEPKREEPRPVERTEPARAELPSPKPVKKEHEIKVDYTPVNAKASREKPKKQDDSKAQEQAANAAAAAAAARRERAIRQALQSLQTGLEVKASQRTIVDVKGPGGEAFADYGSVVRAIYDSKFVPPEDANKLDEAKVRIVVQRDGSILSAEIVSPSGESSWDKAVDRALRAVSSLPKFPEGTTDQTRTFLIRFDVKASEGSG